MGGNIKQIFTWADYKSTTQASKLENCLLKCIKDSIHLGQTEENYKYLSQYSTAQPAFKQSPPNAARRVNAELTYLIVTCHYK